MRPWNGHGEPGRAFVALSELDPLVLSCRNNVPIRLVNDPDQDVAAACTYNAIRLGCAWVEQHLDVFLSKLRSGEDVRVRIAAANAFKLLPPSTLEQHQNEFAQLLQNDDVNVRVNGLILLSLLPLPALKHHEAQIRPLVGAEYLLLRIKATKAIASISSLSDADHLEEVAKEQERLSNILLGDLLRAVSGSEESDSDDE